MAAFTRDFNTTVLFLQLLRVRWYCFYVETFTRGFNTEWFLKVVLGGFSVVLAKTKKPRKAESGFCHP